MSSLYLLRITTIRKCNLLLKIFLCVCVYTQGQQHLFWNNLFEIYEHNCTAERALVGMGETGAWTHIFFGIYEHTFHVHFQNLGTCIRKSKHPCFQCPNEVPGIVTRYFMRLTLCAHMTQNEIHMFVWALNF